jgi:hypothetical protein
VASLSLGRVRADVRGPDAARGEGIDVGGTECRDDPAAIADELGDRAERFARSISAPRGVVGD